MTMLYVESLSIEQLRCRHCSECLMEAAGIKCPKLKSWGVAMLLFLKSVAGGITGLTVIWIIVLSIFLWRSAMSRVSPSGLSSTAGGWDELLHTPWVLLLLIAGFGVGLWVTARWSV